MRATFVSPPARGVVPARLNFGRAAIPLAALTANEDRADTPPGRYRAQPNVRSVGTGDVGGLPDEVNSRIAPQAKRRVGRADMVTGPI